MSHWLKQLSVVLLFRGLRKAAAPCGARAEWSGLTAAGFIKLSHASRDCPHQEARLLRFRPNDHASEKKETDQSYRLEHRIHLHQKKKTDFAEEAATKRTQEPHADVRRDAPPFSLTHSNLSITSPVRQSFVVLLADDSIFFGVSATIATADTLPDVQSPPDFYNEFLFCSSKPATAWIHLLCLFFGCDIAILDVLTRCVSGTFAWPAWHDEETFLRPCATKKNLTLSMKKNSLNQNSTLTQEKQHNSQDERNDLKRKRTQLSSLSLKNNNPNSHYKRKRKQNSVGKNSTVSRKVIIATHSRENNSLKKKKQPSQTKEKTQLSHENTQHSLSLKKKKHSTPSRERKLISFKRTKHSSLSRNIWSLWWRKTKIVVNVWDGTTHTRTYFAFGEGLQDSCHTCSHALWLCAHKGWYCQTELRFSICACHLQLTYCLNQARYRDTPPSLWTGSTQTIRRSINGAIRTRSRCSWRCYPHSLWQCCLAVPPALASHFCSACRSTLVGSLQWSR